MKKNQILSNSYDPLGLLKDESIMKIINFGVVEDFVGRVRCTCRLGFDCRAAGKHPRPDYFPVFLVDDKLLKSGRLNVAIEVPDTFFVLDVDDVDRWRWWLSEQVESERKELEEVLSLSPRVKTGRGIHYYLRVRSESWVDASKWPKIDSGSEIKSRGANISIPPSKHRLGQFYEWQFNEEEVWGPVLDPLPKIFARFLRIRTTCEFLQHKQTLATQNTTAYHLIPQNDWLAVQNQLIFADFPAIDPDLSYESWAEIGYILHSTGQDDAFDVFIAWSKRGRKYKGIQTDKIARGFFEKPYITSIHYADLQKYGIKLWGGSEIEIKKTQ